MEKLKLKILKDIPVGILGMKVEGMDRVRVLHLRRIGIMIAIIVIPIRIEDNKYNE